MTFVINALAMLIWLLVVALWNGLVPVSWPHFPLLWCAGGYLAGAVVGTLAARRRMVKPRRWQ